MNITIRQEQPKDYKNTEQLIKEAFANEAISDQTEHELVRRIRKTDAFVPELSLVVDGNEGVVGQILFSKVTIGEDEVPSLALAHISVHPEFQGIGIGKALMNHGLKLARELGFLSVIVLGHPAFYQKFGFTPAVNFGITPPFPVPDNVFMALELVDHALKGVTGEVKYSKSFME